MYSKDKVRICFVISSLGNSGPVNVLFNIVKYLDKSQFDIHIVTLFKESNHSRLDDFKKLEITIWQSIHAKKKMARAYISLRSSLKKIKPDVVHSHCFYSLEFLSRIRLIFKKVHTLHGYPKEFYHLKYGALIGRVMIFFSFQAYKKMDKVITCAHHFEKGIQKNESIKAIAIRNGVDTSLFNPLSVEDKAALKKKAGYENKVIYIMNNRLSAEKNNRFVVESFPMDKRVHLIIVGDGKEKTELDPIMKSNVSHVQYTGNVLPYLQMSDYYISASKAEGLPMAVLEAISCGLYPILSDIPAHREIITYLEYGLIFSLQTKKDFKGKIESTMNSRKQPTDQFIDQVENNFSAQGMANLHEKLYRELSVQN